MGVIYKATNKINDKAYIGYDKDWPSRIKEHERKANGEDGQYFHNAIAKYGIDNFDWQVLLKDATLEDEIRLIKENKTFWEYRKGYNLTKGGEGKLGYKTSIETKKKISVSHMGKKITEKQLQTLRANAQKMKEQGHTEEVKQKISQSHKGKKFTQEHKKNISLNHASKKETGSYYQSQEYKEKMSKALKGKKRTPEQIERIRLGALKRKKKQ